MRRTFESAGLAFLPLYTAHRKAGWIRVGALGHANLRQLFKRHASRLGLRHLSAGDQAFHHVSQHGFVLEQVAILEHERRVLTKLVHLLLRGLVRVKVDAVQTDGARGRC